jgi:hypothetical protein
MTVFDRNPMETLEIWRFWSKIVIGFLSQFRNFSNPALTRLFALAGVFPWFSRPQHPFLLLSRFSPKYHIYASAEIKWMTVFQGGDHERTRLQKFLCSPRGSGAPTVRSPALRVCGRTAHEGSGSTL